MSRTRNSLFLFAVIVASLAPAGADALPSSNLRIRSLDPARVPVGSPATTVTITGDGFRRDRGPDATRTGSVAHVDNSKVRTKFIDAHHLRVTVPKAFFTDSGSLYVQVWNVLGAGPAAIPTAISNTEGIEVYAVPAAIEVGVPDYETSVGDCFTIELNIVDANGDTMSGEFDITLTADNVTTPESGDGNLTFFRNCWDEREPLEQPIHVEYGREYVEAMTTVPQTVSIIARASEDLVGTSVPLRIAGGYFSGRVTDESGDPVAGVGVHVAWPGEGFFGSVARAGKYPGCYPGQPEPDLYRNRGWYPSLYLDDPVAVTAADGSFTTAAVPPEVRAVYFKPSSDAFLAGAWLGGAAAKSSSEVLKIIDNELVAGVDAILRPGGTISGRVGGADGSLEETAVQIVDPSSGEPIATEMIAADGSYRTTGVAAGDYAIRFEPWADEHVTEWFPNRQELDTAEPVTVTEGADTSSINGTLEPGARLHGSLRDPDGAMSYGRLAVYDPQSGNIVASAWADPYEGFVTEPGIAAGAYKLRAHASSVAAAIDTWYGGDSFSTAETIELSEGEDRAFDMQVARGASFTGTVRAVRPAVGPFGTPEITPLRNVEVRAYDATSGELSAFGCTDSAGIYTTAGLEPGSYQLEFAPQDQTHASVWYPGVPHREHAETLTVAAQEQRFVDMEVHLGRSISGVIRTPTGDPFPAELSDRIFVAAHGQDGVDYFYSEVASDGSFQITGLADGTYRVAAWVYSFYLEERPYVTTWYPAAASEGSGTDIVIAGGDSVGRDIVLGAPSRISGSISGVSALSWAYVDVIDAQSGEVVGSGYQDDNGNYVTGSLRGGTYQLRFLAGGRAPQWYGGARTRADATVIVLPDGGSISGIDVAMRRGNRILGTVRAAHSGASVGGVTMLIVDAATGEELGAGYTTPDGRLRSTFVSPGETKVVFNSHDYYDAQDVFSEQWWADKSSFAAATTIIVPSDANVTGVDASLHLSE